MPTLNALTAPQAPMNKLEAAFAGYLNLLAQQAGVSSPIYRMTFYASTSTAKKTLPACIVWCEEANEVKKGSNVYRGRWFIYPWTQKDDDAAAVPNPSLAPAPLQITAPEVLHDQRLSTIQESLRDSRAIKQVVNYLPNNAATRPVQSFHLSDYYEAEDKHADRQRAFGEALCYEGGFSGYSVRNWS